MERRLVKMPLGWQVLWLKDGAVMLPEDVLMVLVLENARIQEERFFVPSPFLQRLLSDRANREYDRKVAQIP